MDNLAQIDTYMTIEGIAKSRGPMQLSAQPTKEDILIWGCKVEWIEKMEDPMVEFEF
jgi:hypothetical protein